MIVVGLIPVLISAGRSNRNKTFRNRYDAPVSVNFFISEIPKHVVMAGRILASGYFKEQLSKLTRFTPQLHRCPLLRDVARIWCSLGLGIFDLLEVGLPRDTSCWQNNFWPS